MLKPVCFALGLLCLAVTLAPAQVVATLAVAGPSAVHNPHLATADAGGQIGIALPSAPHILLLWNMAGLNFSRIQQQPGAALYTGAEMWVSPSLRPALSHGPVILANANIGRRFGAGLHGYTQVGAGAGWSLDSWAPYVEFQRRNGFHGQPVGHEIVIGVHYILFG